MGRGGSQCECRPSPPSAPGQGDRAHLGGRPVDPAFAVGVNIHQHQPLHQVGEDELPRKKNRAWGWGGLRGAPNFLPRKQAVKFWPCPSHRWLGGSEGKDTLQDATDGDPPAAERDSQELACCSPPLLPTCGLPKFFDSFQIYAYITVLHPPLKYLQRCHCCKTKN